MFRFIKKVLILVLVSHANFLKCISLKSQECKVRNVTVDNKCIAFLYKFKVNRCVGSCNDINNPHPKVSNPDVTKNVAAKMFDQMTLTNTAKQVEFHVSCKCVCKINSSVSSEKQKLSKGKCRCECLINKKCQNDFVWNYGNRECEYKKSAKLIVEEECEEINDFTHNKTISTIKK